MDDLIRIEECEREYKTINKGLITFQSFLSYKNPSWSKKKIANGLKGIKEIREALGWNTTPTRREKQRNPTPSRSTQLCYSCKVPWEPDHRCRGKGKKHIIEVHYDSDDEDSEQSDDDSDSCTEASDSESTSEDSDDDSCIEDSDACTLEEEDDPCVVDRQLDGQDDGTSVSADISHTIDDLTPQQGGDTSEESHVLAPRDDELPMGVVAHLSPVQTPMIATSHEEISGTTGMMDEVSVRDAHHGQVDPQVQEEVQDIQGVDLTHTGQLEEMDSQLLETPVVEQVAEADRLMEHLLPGSTCIDEDALFSLQDDHSMCLDIAIWDPGADDSSRLSAQEDTTAHTGYSVIQGEIAPSDGVQWHTGVPSSTVDSGQFSTSSYAESVFCDSRVGTSRTDTSSGGSEMEPQHDHDQRSHHLVAQLRVSETMIRAATRRIDDMHAVMADYYWRASVAQGSSDGGFSMDDFHTLRERVSMMRTDYQQLLIDRDYLLRVGEMYHEALREQELEMDRLTQELESTRGFLRGTQATPQESESRLDESLEEIHQRSTSFVSVDTQMYQSVTLIEDVDDLAEEHQLMGDTSIPVLGLVDLHVEVDLAAHPRSMMRHESTGDDMSMLEHIVMSDSSQRHVEMYDGIQRGIVPCREETHRGEYVDVTHLQQHIVVGDHLHHFSSYMRDERGRLVDQQSDGLLPVVLDSWDSLMTTGEHLSWIPMEELLVESLGLTKACDTSQSYSQLHICLLSFSDTFIIDRSMRRIADEHRGLLTVISLTQEQLEEIGSDKLPSLPWDPGVHFVNTMFMLTQVAPESHTLHLGLVWSGSAGTCPMGRDLFFHLAIMIGHGEVWIGTSSTKMPIQIQFLDNRSNGHRYFSWRTQERRVQDVFRGQTVMFRVVQCHHEDLRQRLAWDPGIAGLSSSLTDRGEWTMAGESYSNFPLIFSVERSASVAGASQRFCITSVGHQHVQLMEAVRILVEIWRMESFRDEAMGQVQEVHRVDIFPDCSSQSIAVHFLIWDPGGGVCYCSSLDGFYYVSHRWTWDPGILLQGIWVLLEDKQFSSREDCNVPTLGHHHRAEIYDDQSSQMDARESTGVFERHCGVHLALMIIFHHYEPFRIGWLWFRCIPTISMILTILSYKSMEFTEEVILGTLLGGTSQCNSSLELGGEALQDGMARSDFQWPGKPQGEIRRFLEVKRLIN
jgi:hypothetical protein